MSYNLQESDMARLTVILRIMINSVIFRDLFKLIQEKDIIVLNWDGRCAQRFLLFITNKVFIIVFTIHKNLSIMENAKPFISNRYL